MIFLIRVIAATFFLTCLIVSCAGDKELQIANTYNGYLIVSTDGSAIGKISLFDPKGGFVRLLDQLLPGYYTTGHGFLAPNEFFAMIELSQVFERIDFSNWSKTTLFTNTIAGSPVRQLAISAIDKSIFILIGNHNCAEKLIRNSSGSYSIAGSCLVQSTGSCTLSNPSGIAWVSSTNQIAIASMSGAQGISIFNSDASCAGHISSAPFDTDVPLALAYHTLSNKLIVAFNGSHSIYSVNLDGSDATEIFLNTTLMSTIRSLAADKLGNIYVGNNGTDTIEKLYYSGSGTATRVGSSPFISTSAYTTNPTNITVIQ